MKLLLNTTLLFLLVIGFSGGASGQDFEETKRLAEQGNVYSQYRLGLLYANGQGVPQNYAEAVKWLRLSTEQEANALVQHELGKLYGSGQGVPENDAEAVKWYRLAAEVGYPPSQENLALHYFNGEGVPKNDAEAAKWFRLAAEQGEPYSQFSLGFLYARGQGVSQDYIRAYVWSSVAAAQGFEPAGDNRDTFAMDLTSEQLSRAQDMATRCFESDYQDRTLSLWLILVT